MSKPITEALTDILEYSRDKLQDGPYIELSNYLKRLQTKETDNVITTKTTEAFYSLEWTTLKGKKMKFVINKWVKQITRVGPNIDYLEGSLNDKSFNSSRNEITGRLYRLYSLFGMKDIIIKTEDDEEKYKHIEDYKEHLNDLDNYEHYEEYENNTDLRDEYVFNKLVGIYLQCL